MILVILVLCQSLFVLPRGDQCYLRKPLPDQTRQGGHTSFLKSTESGLYHPQYNKYNNICIRSLPFRYVRGLLERSEVHLHSSNDESMETSTAIMQEDRNDKIIKETNTKKANTRKDTE